MPWLPNPPSSSFARVNLHPLANPAILHCTDYSNTVHDIATMTDQDINDLLDAKPHTCLKVFFTGRTASLDQR
jgi:hypothetical protein